MTFSQGHYIPLDKIQGVFVKHYAPGCNKVQKAIFSFKVKIKVTRSLTLVSFEGVCMPNIKSLTLTVQKLEPRLKLTTDRQTNRQTRQKQYEYAPDHSIWGHNKIYLSTVNGA